MMLLFGVHFHSHRAHTHKHTYTVFQVNPRDRPSVSSVLRRHFLEKHISKHLDPQVINLIGSLISSLNTRLSERTSSVSQIQSRQYSD